MPEPVSAVSGRSRWPLSLHMKALALLLLVLASALEARAQGTVMFANYGSFGPNAPVYESDHATLLSGLQFQAELLGGPSTDNLGSIATAGFLTGAGAGYFNGGSQTIIGVAPGNTAWVEVRVWNMANGVTFAQAQASGLPNSWWQSPIFTVTTGGGVVNPSVPAHLTGLGNSPVYLNSVPEPSGLALVGCGLIVGLFKRSLTRQ